MTRSIAALMVSAAALTGYFFGGLNMTASAHPACVPVQAYAELLKTNQLLTDAVKTQAQEIQELRTKYGVVVGQD